MEYLDTRDLSEKLDVLESELADLEGAVEDAETDKERESAQEELDTWKEENGDELNELKDLRYEVPEWEEGNTLIPEPEWIDYVEELLKDCGDLPKNIPWYIVIDWKSTAKNISQDYGTVDYQGTTYYYSY